MKYCFVTLIPCVHPSGACPSHVSLRNRINPLSYKLEQLFADVANSILKLRREDHMLLALKLHEKIWLNPRDTVGLD